MFINIKCNKSDENGRGNFSNVMLVATVKQTREDGKPMSPITFYSGTCGSPNSNFLSKC